MNRAWLLLSCLLVGACVGTFSATDESGGSNPDPSVDGGGTLTPAGNADLRCDVASALARCTSCHASKPIGGAPFALVTRADLTRPSPDDPAQTIAQRCVVRMKSATSTMPPKPGAPSTAAEIAALETWIGAGAPAGACGAADAGPSPYDTPTTCTSGVRWTLGDEGSPDMHPGKTCLSCHAKSIDAPRYAIAGTVYPSAHEPDDCAGKLGGPATVVITDEKGRVYNLPVGARGNFYFKDETASFTPPYRAKVVYQGRERAMTTAQTVADCNTCHTEKGAEGAPGRIMLP